MEGFKKVRDLFLAICLGALIAMFCSSFFRLSFVDGHSMNNTLKHNDVLLVNLKSYKKQPPKREDIVIIERKDLSVKYFVKRIIATEGETLKIENNKVFIDGKELSENYINGEMTTKDLELTIPEGFVFVMGDNRNNSLDSRSNVLGLINVESEILGKAYKLF